MKSKLWILFIAATLLLSACDAFTSTPEAIPTVVLNSSQGGGQETATSNSASVVAASATVQPVDYVTLSFPLTGSVTEVYVADGDTVSAEDALVQLDTAILEAKIVEAEANIKAAETQVAYLKRITESSKENIQAAEAEVVRLQALRDAAVKNLELATLTTPIGGTVASVDIAPGETVVPGLLIVTIGDLTEMELETTDLSERDVPLVQPGQAVTIYLDALDLEVSGTVTAIAAQASSIGGDVVFPVMISIDEPVSGLRWGMSAEVSIDVEG